MTHDGVFRLMPSRTARKRSSVRAVKSVAPHGLESAGAVAPRYQLDAHRKLHADTHVSTAATAARVPATHALLGAPIHEEEPC